MASHRLATRSVMGPPSQQGYGDPYNYPPYLVTPIADMLSGAGQALSIVIPEGCFVDADDDAIHYSATLASGGALPAWLSFNAQTASFSGTPAVGNAGTIEIRVRATDGGPGGDTDDFSLTILSGQVLAGGDGADALQGTAYADSITGAAGDDTLDGGAGIDTLTGGAGNDSYVVDSAQDLVRELAGAGVDTVRTTVAFTLGDDFENLQALGDGAIALRGNALGNVLTGNGARNSLAGLAGDDSLAGGGGHDVIGGGDGADTISGGAGNDTIEGGEGADVLAGGAGNDTYQLGDADQVVEGADLGRDTVRSTIDWTLGQHVEDLVLGGTAHNGAGNALANALNGNGLANTLAGRKGADVLRGALGNDTLLGGAGKDTLTGGTGADAFVFDSPLAAGANVDTITDYGSGADLLTLDAGIFSTFNAGVAIGAARFATGPGVDHATTAAQRLLYDTTSGTLYYDRDGTGTAPALPFAVLGSDTHPVLTIADFLIVA